MSVEEIQVQQNFRMSMQEKLNRIGLILEKQQGDTSIFTPAYLQQLETDKNTLWSDICKISMSAVNYQEIPMPKPLDNSALANEGIITAV